MCKANGENDVSYKGLIAFPNAWSHTLQDDLHAFHTFMKTMVTPKGRYVS